MMNWSGSNQEIWWAIAESVKPPILIYIPDIILTLGIKIKVKNEAAIPLDDLAWMVELDGLVLQGQTTTGNISIQPDSEAKVNARVFGPGPVTIKASIEDEIAQGGCFLLGPFVLFLKGEE